VKESFNMSAVQQTNTNFVRLMWLAVALALGAALAYVMIAWRYLGVGNLQTPDDGAAIIYVAAASYLIGGLLILLRNRWLWIAGAVMNALVILFYAQMYVNQPEVLLSAGGLLTKAAQVLLEVVLIYLIVADWKKSRNQAIKA
jgi:hypothetical protein